MELLEVDNANHDELIRAVGEHLWGSRWQTDMAIALGVNDRTVRRWASGAQVPQPGIWAELIPIIRRRRVELSELLKMVVQHARSAGEQ